MECKASIRLRASTDGQSLEVKSVDEVHNHETNTVQFRNLFQQRRLNTTQKEEMKNMLEVKANKKLIQTNLMKTTGKVIHLKDIHNVGSSIRFSNPSATLQDTVKELSKADGAYVRLFKSDNNELRGLFFQDQRMRSTFEKFPEVVCVDATFKLNDLRMPLYIMVVENGNGDSEVVAMWIVTDETKETISDMIGIFKEQNAARSKVNTIMSDKDFVEREVFGTLFPDARLRICLFHVLRTFKREITVEKMGITKQDRETLLDLLQKLAYARTLEEYNALKQNLDDCGIDSAKTYFNNSWDPLKEQWVDGLAQGSSFGNRTNNRVESINQKLKQVVCKLSKLDSFAKNFLAFLNMHRTEIDRKISKTTVK